MKKLSMGNAICVAVCGGVCVGRAGLETRSRLDVVPQSSWDEIRGIPGLTVNAPMIPFGARAVAVTDLCRSEDRLRATAADGAALATPAAGHRSSYTIEVGTVVGDGETSKFRALFVKPCEVPACK